MPLAACFERFVYLDSGVETAIFYRLPCTIFTLGRILESYCLKWMFTINDLKSSITCFKNMDWNFHFMPQTWPIKSSLVLLVAFMPYILVVPLQVVTLPDNLNVTKTYWPIVSVFSEYFGSCNFSWFYKISHLLKWLNLPFIIYLLLYWFYHPQNVFGSDKSIFSLRNKNCFDGKPKMTKNLNLEKLKKPNPDIWPIGEIFNFSNSIVFVIFGFRLKKYFFLRANIPKKVWGW